MGLPIPGKQYIVQDEDTLSQIAQRAYGDAQYWPRIFQANQSNLKSDNPDTIFPGTVINIPVIPEVDQLKNNVTSNLNISNEKNKLTILIDGIEIKTESVRLLTAMDNIANGWTAVMPWTPGENPELDEKTKPFSYAPASVFIGNELITSGLLYTVEPTETPSGIVKILEGWTFTADIIDSTLKPPYEKKDFTFLQILTDIVIQFGISVFSELDPSELGGKFDRVTVSETESVGNFLLKLATQRGLLIGATPSGNILISKTTTDLTPVAVIEAGQQGTTEFKARFDGRERFNAYRLLGRSPLGNKVGIANDNAVPRSRFRTFTADETIEGDIEKAAQWKRSKTLAQALNIPLPVDSWFSNNGNLWKENTIVTVKSDVLSIPDGFDFLIRSAEFIEQNDSQSAILNIVPPQAYTGEELVEPWL